MMIYSEKLRSVLLMLFLLFLFGCEKETNDHYIKDIDGNKYKIIQIGSMTWMAENLKVTRDKDGNPLTTYCYADNTNKCEEFGRLYPWEEAKKASPKGWRLPTEDDWKELEIYLGMDPSESDSLGWRGTDQGTQLKEGGISGFNALLAGYKDGTVLWDGRYFDIGYYGGFWSAKEHDSLTAIGYWVYVTSERILKTNYDRTAALSIRCIKDN
jgi:uncharacterized protein (TIGR02145 family)